LACTDEICISVCVRGLTVPPPIQTLFADLAQQVATAPRSGSVWASSRSRRKFADWCSL